MTSEQPNREELLGDGIESITRFRDIKFTEQKDKKGVVIGYVSSAPGRKQIKLTAIPDGKVKIDTKKSYNVKIVGDSDPEDQFSGYYLALIDTDEIPDWEKSEDVVGNAEVSQRELRKTKRILYKETGLTDEERSEKTDDEIIAEADRPRVAKKALETEGTQEKVLDEVLGDDGSFERQFIDFKLDNLRKALKTNAELEKKISALQKQKQAVLDGISGEPSGVELDVVEEIDAEISKAELNLEQLTKSSPEAYYGLNLKRLKEYKRDLLEGKIVETPYVEDKIEDVVSHIRAGKPVMIYGHLGSGKTELALHVARNYILANRPDIDEAVQTEFLEWAKSNPDASEDEKKVKLDQIDSARRSALVVSGSKNMSASELYGHQILDIEKIKREELDAFVKDVEDLYQKWLEENKDRLVSLSESEAGEERSRAHDRFLQTYLTQFKSGTISDFFLGPIYRAMSEGRPIIIDEVNAIPHEILISLNHILTRKPGDQINVQQNSGTAITVKNGYGVIMTGNLNQGENKYVDRQDMDPAFLSRLHKIEYDYLPQKTEGSLHNEAGEENELYHLLLARVMDKNGNIELPKDSLDKLWDLAKAARVIQNVFAGKETSSAFYFKTPGARPIKYILKESVLSLRGIDKIITQWQKEGYKYELDYYLWTEFVSQSTNATDKAYLFQVLREQFDFFSPRNGWYSSPNYGNGGNLSHFDITVPKNKSGVIDFTTPRQVVDHAMGFDNQVERKTWPGGKTVEDVKKNDEKLDAGDDENAEKLEGRDPEEFINKLYNYAVMEGINVSRSGYNWTPTVDGKYIDMIIDKEWFSDEYIDATYNSNMIDIGVFSDQRSGIDSLIEFLKGKKINSVVIEGSLFLKVL